MSILGERTILAIDPGSSKVGMALVRRDETGKMNLIWRAIVPVEDVCARIEEAEAVAGFSMIVVGNGTRSRELVARLREEQAGTGILMIDEKNTTLEARERYWEFNPRRGWRRFLPATMQSPPEPVDDFAAFVLAERVLNAG